MTIKEKTDLHIQIKKWMTFSSSCQNAIPRLQLCPLLCYMYAYSSNYKLPHSIALDLPVTLTTPVDEKAQAMNFHELIKFSESIDNSVSE